MVFQRLVIRPCSVIMYPRRGSLCKCYSPGSQYPSLPGATGCFGFVKLKWQRGGLGWSDQDYAGRVARTMGNYNLRRASGIAQEKEQRTHFS